MLKFIFNLRDSIIISNSFSTDDKVFSTKDMWSINYVGLYCQYAAVGLLYGSSGTLIPFCAYAFKGPTNVCANAKNITFFAWNIKLFFAILTDCIRPFGMRRKPWMIMGWAMVLILLLVLATSSSYMSVSVWLSTLLFLQGFMMLSDVPADGYSAELGHRESPEQRGQIFITGQRIEFSFCIFAGLIQTLLLNGPSTNDASCPQSLSQCWSWGLTIDQYYLLLFFITLGLTLPILWLRELDIHTHKDEIVDSDEEKFDDIDSARVPPPFFGINSTPDEHLQSLASYSLGDSVEALEASRDSDSAVEELDIHAHKDEVIDSEEEKVEAIDASRVPPPFLGIHSTPDEHLQSLASYSLGDSVEAPEASCDNESAEEKLDIHVHKDEIVDFEEEKVDARVPPPFLGIHSSPDEHLQSLGSYSLGDSVEAPEASRDSDKAVDPMQKEHSSTVHFSHFIHEIWLTLQNLTTFYLLIFAIGTHSLTNFSSNVNISLQYYVMKLSNLQAGISTMTTFLALVAAIWIFQTFLINRNWRITQYGSTFIAALLGLVWIAPYYNAGGTMNPWFTIFIDVDTYFVQGLTEILYLLAVMELSKPGLESTTYELIITVGNACQLANGVISTQLLYPMRAVGCTDNVAHCDLSTSVVVTSKDSFEASDGPNRFRNYALLLFGITLAACLVFTPFLPRSKDECQQWKELGHKAGCSETRGKVALALCVVTCLYGLIVSILLLEPNTACEPAIGGSGC